MAKKIKINNSDEVVVKYAEKDCSGTDIDIAGIRNEIPSKTSQLTNDSNFTTLSAVATQEHNYRYMHNVRLYLANKMLIRVNYIISKTQSSSYAATAPSTLANLARALYYAGATSQNNAIPATGMIYINDNTTGIVTGIYSIGSSANASYVYVTYLPLVTSSGSDATIAVNVPAESTKQVSLVGTPSITAYVKME